MKGIKLTRVYDGGRHRCDENNHDKYRNWQIPHVVLRLHMAHLVKLGCHDSCLGVRRGVCNAVRNQAKSKQ